jgi:cytochrome d ubiquinol oxidase subunit II
MGTLWYSLVALMVAGYVILDGYDLGAGVIHLGIAKTEAERRQVLQSIGPLWDGNEVFLVALGGTLFFAFPRLYAVSFSGFYLPLMIVLWLLIFRGMAVEFRSHVNDAVWRGFWDVVFTFASGLLAVVFGVAIGNVIRGVDFDPSGTFFLPLWTDFGVAPPVGALDWYTGLVGLFSLSVMTLHGALWIALRTAGGLQQRARRAAAIAWACVLVTGALVTVLSFKLQPLLARNLAATPWGVVFPALAVGGLLVARLNSHRGHDHQAFFASSIAIAGMVGSAAFGIYPYVLPSLGGPALTVDNTLAGAHGLAIGILWWAPGMFLAAIYIIYAHIVFSSKVTPGAGGY